MKLVKHNLEDYVDGRAANTRGTMRMRIGRAGDIDANCGDNEGVHRWGYIGWGTLKGRWSNTVTRIEEYI